VPTFLIVTILSGLYFRFGTLPQVETIFWGLQPVIVAIVLSAGWKMARAAVTSVTQAGLALLGAVVSLLSGQAVIAAMLAGGGVTWWARRQERRGGSPDPPDQGSPPPRLPEGGSAWLPLQVGALGATLGTMGTVFLTHLWIGSVLFGGGYVMVALLQPYAVAQYGWLTNAQFLDGVALTQAVPGPISTLSAFVGYAAAGVPGAFLATAGIYIPSFAAVLVVAPRVERLRQVDSVRHALEGVVAVAAGAVAGVGVALAVSGVRDVFSGAIAAAALALATWWKVPALGLVGGGLAAGLARAMAG
jgi:chromate transporter